MTFNWKKSVAIDLFDNEFIIAHLETGLYYMMEGQAVSFFSNLPFTSFETELNKFIDEKKIDNNEIEAIKKVWEILLEDEIVVNADISKTNNKSFEVSGLAFSSSSKLNKYADMQDLLMLDPIHEVDEKGWPTKNEA